MSLRHRNTVSNDVHKNQRKRRSRNNSQQQVSGNVLLPINAEEDNTVFDNDLLDDDMDDTREIYFGWCCLGIVVITIIVALGLILPLALIDRSVDVPVTNSTTAITTSEATTTFVPNTTSDVGTTTSAPLPTTTPTPTTTTEMVTTTTVVAPTTTPPGICAVCVAMVGSGGGMCNTEYMACMGSGLCNVLCLLPFIDNNPIDAGCNSGGIPEWPPLENCLCANCTLECTECPGTTTLAPTTLPPTTTPVPTTPPPCMCPDFNTVLTFSAFDGGNEALAFNSADGLLYRFNGGTATLQNMNPINITGYPPTAVELPNIAPGGSFAGLPANRDIRAAVYDPMTNTFLLEARSDLWAMQTDGTSSVFLGDFMNNRGFALVNGTTLLSVDNNDDQLFEVEKTNGTVLKTETCMDVRGNSVGLFGISWDPVTEAIYVIFNSPDTMGREIGKLTRNPCRVSYLCSEIDMETMRTMTFDDTGRLWMASGNPGSTPHTLFAFDYAPCDLFEIACPADYVGFLEETAISPTVTGMATVVGMGCNDDPINITFTDSDVFPMISKKDVGIPVNPHHGEQLTKTHPIVFEAVAMGHVDNATVVVSNGTSNDFDSINDLNDLLLGRNQKRSITFDQNRFNYTSQVSVDTLTPADDFQIQTAYGMDLIFDGYLLTTPDNGRLLYHSAGPVMTILIDSIFVSAPCDAAVHPYNVWFDYEFGTYIFLGVARNATNGDYLCVARSLNPTDPSAGGWDTYVFQTNNQTISRLTSGHWGDYYVLSWNDLKSDPEAKQFVLERERILYGGGPPRIIEVPGPGASLPVGLKVSSHPLSLGLGPRGTATTTFCPCGCFLTYLPTAPSNANLHVTYCETVNFNTQIITQSVSTSGTGALEDQSVGNCTASDECIPTLGVVEKDPLRGTIRWSYKESTFQSNGVALVFSYDANGVNRSKVRWITGELTASGIIPGALGGDGIIENSLEHMWAADVYLDAYGNIFIGLSTSNSTIPGQPRVTYRFRTDPVNQLRKVAEPREWFLTSFSSPNNNWAPNYIAPINGLPRGFNYAYSHPESGTGTTRTFSQFMLAAPEIVFRTFMATDACNKTAMCEQRIELTDLPIPSDLSTTTPTPTTGPPEPCNMCVADAIAVSGNCAVENVACSNNGLCPLMCRDPFWLTDTPAGPMCYGPTIPEWPPLESCLCQECPQCAACPVTTTTFPPTTAP